MKKLSLAVAVAATLGAGVAGAYTVAVPADGVLVPNVIHNGTSDTTAVALINHSTANAEIYWTFFNQDSVHITDGQFTMTGGDMETFIWSERAGLDTEGMRGYLVFASGTPATPTTPANPTAITTGRISAAAFQADAVNGDAIFVPTFPLEAGTNVDSIQAAATVALPNGPIATPFDGDYLAGSDLSVMDHLSLTSVTGGAQAGSTVAMRYAMDSDFSTAIVLWATGNLKDSFTVNMFNDEQNRKSVNFVCGNTELCFVNPASIVGRPADFTNGYIVFNTPTDLNENLSTTLLLSGGSFVSYSAIRSVSYGATQTILNTHY